MAEERMVTEYILLKGRYEIRPRQNAPMDNVRESKAGADHLLQAHETMCEHLHAVGFNNVHFEVDEYYRDGSFRVSVWGKYQ